VKQTLAILTLVRARDLLDQEAVLVPAVVLAPVPEVVAVQEVLAQELLELAPPPAAVLEVDLDLAQVLEADRALEVGLAAVLEVVLAQEAVLDQDQALEVVLVPVAVLVLVLDQEVVLVPAARAAVLVLAAPVAVLVLDLVQVLEVVLVRREVDLKLDLIPVKRASRKRFVRYFLT